MLNKMFNLCYYKLNFDDSPPTQQYVNCMDGGGDSRIPQNEHNNFGLPWITDLGLKAKLE